MTRFLAIAFKDLKIWVRDPAALGVLLGMPVLLILILGSAFGGLGGGEGGMGIRVALVNLDAGDESGAAVSSETQNLGDEVIGSFTGNEQLADLFEIEESDNAGDVRERVEGGDLQAALIIPEDFTARVNDAQPVDIEVLRDPGSDLSSGIFESVARSIANEMSRVSVIAQASGAAAAQAGLDQQAIGQVVGLAVQRATAEDVSAAVSVTASEIEQGENEVTPLSFFSMSMTAMFMLFGSMFGAFAFITERRELTMSRLLTTPTARSSFVGGKMFGIFLLGILQFAVLYTYTSTMMDVDWGRSVAGTWLVAAAEILASTGLAVLIASIAKSERGAGAIGPLVIQVMALIGGAFFPISVMPEWLQPVRYASVIGWALKGFQDVQLQGAGPSDLVGTLAALVGMAVVFFGIGVWRLRDDR